MNSTCQYIGPSYLTKLVWRFKAWLKRNEPSNLELHALRELKALGYPPLDQCQEDGPNKWMQENILELVRVFVRQGHSGSSASYCINILNKLARFEPVAPLTGDDGEWQEVGHGVWQNSRCSRVFKDPDGRAYDIDGKVFKDPDGGYYTNQDSRVYITFPYEPKTEYVDR